MNQSTGPGTSAAGTAAFSMYPWSRKAVLVSWPVLVAVPLVALTVACLHQRKGAAVVCGVVVALAIYGAYRWMFTVSTRVEVYDQFLHWWTPLRHGEVPLSSLREIRRARGNPFYMMFISADHPAVRGAAGRPGATAFCEEAARRAPQASLKLGRATRKSDAASYLPAGYQPPPPGKS
jgi:hypothetical protein